MEAISLPYSVHFSTEILGSIPRSGKQKRGRDVDMRALTFANAGFRLILLVSRARLNDRFGYECRYNASNGLRTPLPPF
jgi:hypothetical protein